MEDNCSGSTTSLKRVKDIIIGKPRDPFDEGIFHKISLIAFFAWVGLGADGLSSSCYGPEEAFLVLKDHPHLAIIIGLASALTVFVISSSYSQIIELFPGGGGGYLVASKLLTPKVGMLSGCALLVDYVLTITLSVASGADAIFSLLPPSWYQYKIVLAAVGVVVLTVLNMRGVKESVVPLVPIFIIFIITHAFGILYAFVIHLPELQSASTGFVEDFQQTHAQLGFVGMLLLLVRSYSLGAGTYTGIEAVSNGLPILREPKVQTAKKTMRYMAFSLALMVFGLLISYLLFQVKYTPGKTLNAVLFTQLTKNWGHFWGYNFVLITLFSEAALLFVAAQTGFLDGPRVLSNMALDRWFPTRFAMLSDRLVTQNGIMLMGAASFILMILAKGSVRFMVVLYSINVFVTFTLSQLGMVRHWWSFRKKESQWLRKLTLNGVGLCLTLLILFSVIIAKFDEGGWITIVVTGSLVAAALLIRRHYVKTAVLLRRLDTLVKAAETSGFEEHDKPKDRKYPPEFNPEARTAVLMVNGFNGLGLHSLFAIFRLFGKEFENYVFIQVGMVDAGNFKGSQEIAGLEKHVQTEAQRYVDFIKRHGYYAESFSSVGIDVVDEVTKLSEKVSERFPNALFFGGQLVFPVDTFVTRLLHNYTVFAVQRKFYHMGLPFIILPVRV